MKPLFIAALALALALPARAANPLSTERIGFGTDDLLAQRIAGSEIIASPSDALAGYQFRLLLEIDTAGKVADVRLAPGEEELAAPARTAIGAVKAWRFRPFEWKGRPVGAIGIVYVRYGAGEKPGRAEPPFPDTTDGWSVSLNRGPSLWRPVYMYTITIRSDGTSVFEAEQSQLDGMPLTSRFTVDQVLVPGRHEGRVASADLDALLRRLRDVRFFGLDDRYEADITDLITVTTTVTAGGQTKSVADYYGVAVGMPAALVEIENEIDRIAGTDKWVVGSPETIPALEAEGVSLSPAEGAELLGLAERRSAPQPFVVDLLARGYPLDVPWTPDEESPPMPLGQWMVGQAARNGRADVLERLKDLGELARANKAVLDAAFISGMLCDLRTAQLLAPFVSSPAVQDSASGSTALMASASRLACGRAKDRQAGFVAGLIALGVPADAVDRRGRTALFHLDNHAIAAALLAAGADPNRATPEGLAAIHTTTDDRVALTLLDAGARPDGLSESGQTLRQTAEENFMAGTLSWLDAHGVP